MPSCCYAPLGTTLTVPQDYGQVLFESWYTEDEVDIHVKIYQGERLVEVPLYDWKLLSRNILRQS